MSARHSGSVGEAGQGYGAIIVGGGHNGLICATYLARNGIRTLVIEARSSVGGCASTETALGGARVNICNCDHAMIRATPIAEELELSRHGLGYLDVDPTYSYQHWDGGDSWFLFHDIERTLESLGCSYPKEVDNYRNYVKKALPVARMVAEIGSDRPTPGNVAKSSLRKVGSTSKAIPTLLQWSKRSVGDVVRSFFEAPQLQSPLVATGPSVWGLSPDFPNTGLGALGYAMRHVVQIGRPEGGSGALTDAVASSFCEAGGVIRTRCKVTQILCGQHESPGSVNGVRIELENGEKEEISAPIVVIATDPRVAFVEWLDQVPAAAYSMINRYRKMPIHDGYESKIDAVLDEPYLANGVTHKVCSALGLTEHDARKPSLIVAPPLAEIARDHARQKQGWIADRPQMFVQTPSALDATVGRNIPAGHHVFSLEVLWTPYELDGGWTATSEPQRWLRKVSEVVTTASGKPFHETVVDWRLMGPREYESQFFMHRGHAVAYAGTPVTALLGTSREQSRYETPIAGLFLTGAATFPGAGIWGASGRNAAHAVLAADGLRTRAGRTLAKAR